MWESLLIVHSYYVCTAHRYCATGSGHGSGFPSALSGVCSIHNITTLSLEAVMVHVLTAHPEFTAVVMAASRDYLLRAVAKACMLKQSVG